MASRPMILVSALFAATLISAVVGYAIYWSYASVLRDFRGQPTVYDVLSRVSRVEYNVSSPDDGNFTVILENNPQSGEATLRMVDANGSIVALYKFKYDRNGVTEAVRVDPETGEEIVVTPGDMENLLFTPVKFTVNETQTGLASVSVSPQPSLGPLVLPYVVAEEFRMDWVTARSQLAQVRIGFTQVDWDGGKVKGVAATVEPRTTTPLTQWSRATLIALVMARVNGVPAAVQATIVAGQDSVEFKLTALEPAGG